MSHKILILDDEPAVTDSLRLYLNAMKYSPYTANRVSDALRLLEAHDIDVVLLDIQMPEMDGIRFLNRIKPLYPQLQVIMISALYQHDVVVRAMQDGAVDFIRKPFEMDEVLMAIQRALNIQHKENALSHSEWRFSKLTSLMQNDTKVNLIYESKAMAEVVRLATTIAAIDEVPVLITGESGTGKEVIARYIHTQSARRNKVFIPANCASIPYDLFESEFFGHRKGSFTGATEHQTGLFELATDGFLFLDEVTEMDLRLQPKLLRVLESREVMPIGARKVTPVNTRVVAATNKEVSKAITDGRFRNDLYHRLGVFEIHIPPLRNRREDIPLLFEHFLKQLSQKHGKGINGYDPVIPEQLAAHPFPGNVRELRNRVERAVIIATGSTLALNDLRLQGNGNGNPLPISPTGTPESFNLDQHEYALIVKALAAHAQSVLSASRAMGISQQSLRRKMKRLGIR